jgi:hypothetical protein
MSLTDTEIRKSKPGAKAYRLADTKGLFLFVTPTGGKLWRYKYRHGGLQKLMAIGKYPDVPLALARERHAEARRLLATGLDPMEQRKVAKTAEKAAAENSFRTIAGLWFEHWRAEKSAQHVDATRRRMDANILPLLGARPITEIEAPELVTMVKMIEGRGAADLAKRAMQNVGQIFRYAIAHGCFETNPQNKPCTDRRKRSSGVVEVDGGLPGNSRNPISDEAHGANVCPHQRIDRCQGGRVRHGRCPLEHSCSANENARPSHCSSRLADNRSAGNASLADWIE